VCRYGKDQGKIGIKFRIWNILLQVCIVKFKNIFKILKNSYGELDNPHR
jgi:hypothetical protein